MQPILQHWALEISDAIPNFLIAIGIFVVSLYVAHVAANVVSRLLQRRRIVSNVVSLLAHALYWTIVVIGLVMALQRFFDVTAFLAGLGIIGFTVGFALQDVMKNFAAGIILLLQQPFRVGEAISVAGFDGTILTIDLRATEMSTFDGRLVSLPNATVLTNPIINYTRAARRRVDLPLQLQPGIDLEAARQIVIDAIHHTPGAVAEPPPTVVLQQFGDSSVSLAGSFWIDVTQANPDQAKDAALTQILSSLERQKGQAQQPGQSETSRSDGSQQPS